MSTSKIAFSSPVAFLALFSALKYLTVGIVVIFMTVYRVTSPRLFFVYLTGNLLYDDILITAVAAAVCVTFYFKSKWLLACSLGAVLAPLAITMAIDNLLLLDIATLAMFPGILGSYYLLRKKVDLGKRITRNSLIMTGAGILFVLESLSLLTWIIYPSYAPYWGKIFSAAPEWYLAGFEAQLFYAGARLAPAIALILSFSLLIRPSAHLLFRVFTGKNIADTEPSRDSTVEQAAGSTGAVPQGENAASPVASNSQTKYRPGAIGRSSPLTVAEVSEAAEQQAIAEPTLEELKKLHPNLRARRKLGMKGARNQIRANRMLQSKQGSDKIESRLSALAATQAAVKARSTSRFWFSVSIVLVILFTLYPYIPTINKDFGTISVDAGYYTQQIDNIKNNGIFSPGGPFSFSSERALSVLFFYGLAAALPMVPTKVFVAYLPMLLGSFLVVSAYLLIRYGKKVENIGAPERATYFLLPLLVPFSTQLIVGIYGGFFSNMLALSFMLLTFLFYLRFLKSSKILDLGLFVAMMFMTLFSHVYTWVFLIATLVVSTVLLGVFNRKSEKKKTHIAVIATVGVTIAVLFGISTLISSKSGVSYLTDLVSTSFGQDFFATRWFNLNNTFRFYLGGLLANTVLMGLALVWAFKADYKNHFNAIIFASLSIFSAFFFLGNEVIQSRIFFNIPLFIPAAITLSNFMAGKYAQALDSRTRSTIVVLIFLVIGNYALRSLANLYLVEPGRPLS